LDSTATGSFDVSAVLESRDDNYDGSIDRTTVLFIDRTGSVVGYYGDDSTAGKQVERLLYNMTGQPFLMPWGDVDGDGDSDASDTGWVNILWTFSLYDVRADLDLDGDVDSVDYAAHAQQGGHVKVSNDYNRLGVRALHAQLGLAHVAGGGIQTALGVRLTRRNTDALYRVNPYNFQIFNSESSIVVAHGSGVGLMVRFTDEPHLNWEPWYHGLPGEPLTWYQEEECCWNAFAPGEGAWGKVVCCYGRHAVCINGEAIWSWGASGPGDTDPGREGRETARKAIVDCARGHEMMHIAQGEVGNCGCNDQYSSGLCGAGNSPSNGANAGWASDIDTQEERNAAEQDNYRWEIGCLSDLNARCDDDPECERLMDDRQQYLREGARRLDGRE
jgi:hypothetical protein